MENVPVLSTFVVALISAVVGYAFSLWRNRIRPWITIEGISETRNASELVTVPEGFVDLAAKSWWGQPSSTKVTLEEFMSLLEAAQDWLQQTERSEEVATVVCQRLRASDSDAETISALTDFFEDGGLRNGVWLAADWGEIVIPECTTDRPRQIPFYLDESRLGGVLAFDFPKAIWLMGTNLLARPPLGEKLEMFAELVSRLEAGPVAEVVEKTAERARAQRKIARAMVELGTPVALRYSRWQCSFSITNFGPTPFIIFPEETDLVIHGKKIKRIELDCQMLTYDGDTGWQIANGVVLAKEGTTHDLACATKAQHEMDQGEMLQGVFQQGDGKAVLHLKVLSRDLPWRRTVRSIAIPFRE